MSTAKRVALAGIALSITVPGGDTGEGKREGIRIGSGYGSRSQSMA